MNESTIGINIAKLRKERGITQEALAEVFHLTPQAISKWESGGSPDASLLPALADYFGVSIDRLFGRRSFDYTNLGAEAYKYLASLPAQERIRKAYDICFAFHYAFVDMPFPDNLVEMMETVESVVKLGVAHGEININEGVVKSGIDEALQYFIIMPKPENGWGDRLQYKEEYATLFAHLGQEDLLKSLLFLEARENKNKSFTSRLLEKEFGLTETRATEILHIFAEYGFVEIKELELDDEVKCIYNYNSCLSILPFLIFAEELAQRPMTFYVKWDDKACLPLLSKKGNETS